MISPRFSGLLVGFNLTCALLTLFALLFGHVTPTPWQTYNQSPNQNQPLYNTFSPPNSDSAPPADAYNRQLYSSPAGNPPVNMGNGNGMGMAPVPVPPQLAALPAKSQDSSYFSTALSYLPTWSFTSPFNWFTPTKTKEQILEEALSNVQGMEKCALTGSSCERAFECCSGTCTDSWNWFASKKCTAFVPEVPESAEGENQPQIQPGYYQPLPQAEPTLHPGASPYLPFKF